MANYYVGIVDRGGEGWGATFPDLPGCTSGGRTMAELFEMCIEAVGLWAEEARVAGDALPTPRTIDVLLEDPQVKATIEAVGPVSFIQVPVLLDAGRAVRTNISLDAGLLEGIDAAAKRRGVTRSAFLASAAREKIGQG